MTKIIAFYLVLTVGLFAQSTKVGGSGTTKVGGSGTTKVSAYVPAAATFTEISKANNYGAGSGTTITVGATSVAAGDLVVVWVGNVSAATHTVSDGTSSLTGLNVSSIGGNRGQFFYILSSVATGSVTYTVTFSGSSFGRWAHVYVLRPSAACSFDNQTTTGFDFGTTAVTTNSMTTASGSVVTFGGQANEGAATSSNETFNSIARDSEQDASGVASWYVKTTTPYTAGGAATLSAATNWWSISCSFKIP